MQNKRALAILLVSIAVGLVAVAMAAKWMGQQAASDRKPVIVVTKNLLAGEAITADAVQVVSWPSDGLPEGAFAEAAKVEGRVTRVQMFKGEPVLGLKLAPLGTKAGLDSLIKPGHRAITVKVNEVLGVAGFLASGSYVDLLVNIKDDKEKSVSRVVLERIMILAVAQESQRPDETKPKVVDAVTLEVTPPQAEKIDLARNIGTLSLMLRNQGDTVQAPTAGMRKQDLFDDASPASKNMLASTVVVVRPKTLPQPAAAKAALPGKAAAVATEPAFEIIRGLQTSQPTL